MIRGKWIGGSLLTLAVAGVAVGADEPKKEPKPTRNNTAAQESQRDQDRSSQDPDQAARRATDKARKQDSQADTARQTRSKKAHLGARLGPSPTSGVRVDELQPGGNASRAGLRPGDYILTLDGQKVGSPAELEAQIEKIGIGKSATVGIWRNGQNVSLPMTFVETRQAAFRDGNQNGARGERPNATTDKQPWLGISFKRGEDGKEGVEVMGVYPSGPAARAGFYAGDQVKSIDGKKVDNFDQILSALQTMKPGQQAKFAVGRGEEEVQLTATLGNRSDFLYEQAAQQGEANGTDNQQASEDSDEPEIPEHAMMLEFQRRQAEQAQRLEERLDLVMKELRELRAEVRTGRPAAQPRANVRPGANVLPGASTTEPARPQTPANALPRPGVGTAPRGTATRGIGASRDTRPGSQSSGGTTTRGNP